MVWERLKDRNNVIALLLALIAVVLVFRLVQLQIVNGEYYSDLSENKRIRRIAVEAPRGLFLDRYGREIAGNRPGYVVEVVKTEIVQETISYVAQELVGILDSNGEHIRLDFAIGDDPLRFKLDSGKEAEWKDKYEIPREYDAAQALAFLREKHGIAPEMTDELALKALAILHKIGEQSYLAYQPLEIARDVSALTVAQIEERHLDLPGINVEVKPIRYYKEGNLASHVLGYLGSINHEELESLEDKGYTQNDIIGKSGLERVLEEELKGISGARQVEVNSVGRLISTLGERQSIPGNNVFLTLDSRLQQTAQRALRETMEKIQAGEMGTKYPNAKSGAAVAIDVNTGEVLAMASYPSYDPNLFATGISSEDWGALNPQSNDPLEPRPLYNN
ncbi:MAG: penicillin-binding transpeptidase domain-containing protein, partial [Bacillota bacterium]